MMKRHPLSPSALKTSVGAPLFGAPNRSLKQIALLSAGWLCVGSGVVGIVVPLMPSTVFFIVAAWCFARACPRLETWILEHPRYGPPVRAWRDHGAIPRKAKVLATIMITISISIVVMATRDQHWSIPTLIGGSLSILIIWIVSRPHAH